MLYKKLKKNILLLCFSAFLMANSAHSKPEHDYTELSLQELMSLEIFTAASMIPTEIKKAPGTVYSFNRHDFLRLGVRRVDELLEYVPGFQLNQYRKHHRSIWSRGVIDRYNNKMKLLIDGVPIQHVYYGHFSGGDNLALEKVEKVEVIMGPASSLYGANAFAGVISITTRPFTDKEDANYLESTLEIADNNRAKGSVFYNSDKLQGFVSYLDQDVPYDENRKSFIGRDVSQSMDEKYKNVYFKAEPVKGLIFSFDYQHNETPFLFYPDNSPEDTDSNTEENFYNFSAQYKTGDLDTGKLEAIAYYIEDQATEEVERKNSGQLAEKEHRDSIYYGVKATWFKTLFSAHTLAIGAEWQHDEAKDMDFIAHWKWDTGLLTPAKTGSLLSDDNEENNDYAVFVQDVWTISDKLTATLGGRYDVFDKFDNDSNFRAALVYTLSEEQNLKILWGTGVRKPTYREYLYVLEDNTSGFVPPALETEEMETFELGYSYQWQDAYISTTAFYNEFEDYIFDTEAPGGDEYFLNSEDAWRMYGVEILSEYKPSKNLSFRATLGWIDAEEKGSGDLAYIAEWTASFFTDYQWHPKQFVALSLFYNSDREDTNDEKYTDDEPDSFVTLNVQARGHLMENISYQIGVKNLTDEKVYDPTADTGDFESWRYNTQRTEREIWGKLMYTYKF